MKVQTMVDPIEKLGENGTDFVALIAYRDDSDFSFCRCGWLYNDEDSYAISSGDDWLYLVDGYKYGDKEAEFVGVKSLKYKCHIYYIARHSQDDEWLVDTDAVGATYGAFGYEYDGEIVAQLVCDIFRNLCNQPNYKRFERDFDYEY